LAIAVYCSMNCEPEALTSTDPDKSRSILMVSGRAIHRTRRADGMTEAIRRLQRLAQEVWFARQALTDGTRPTHKCRGQTDKALYLGIALQVIF